MGNWMYSAQLPLRNALVLSKLREYRHKRYVAKNSYTVFKNVEASNFFH